MDEAMLKVWLDPEAPDPWGNVPSRFLTAEGFAVRLLRSIEGLERDGTPPEVLVRILRRRCEDLVKRRDGGEL